MSAPILYLVIPCYNEEEVLPLTIQTLSVKMKQLIARQRIAENSRILFVNDGSKDKTWQLIKEAHEQESLCAGLDLTRNRGHQNALLAGLMSAMPYADITVSMDADLQDDIAVIDLFLDSYAQGHDIVYGVRGSREQDSWFKRTSAQLFYRLQHSMGVEAVYNHADCRLLSRQALQDLARFPEINLYLRGMIPLIGYQSDIVEYTRQRRSAGTSKYPLKKMLAFAWDGITSFSVRPIRLVSLIGAIVFLISIATISYSVIRKCMGMTVDGWTFLSCSIWLLGGITLLGMGIIGEYIGKIYTEVKRRPRYLIREILNDPKPRAHD